MLDEVVLLVAHFKSGDTEIVIEAGITKYGSRITSPDDIIEKVKHGYIEDRETNFKNTVREVLKKFPDAKLDYQPTFDPCVCGGAILAREVIEEIKKEENKNETLWT